MAGTSRPRQDVRNDPDHAGGRAATYLISVAGSAGGFHSLRQLLNTLPRDCPAAVSVVLHIGPGSVLVDALETRSNLPVRWARSGDLLQAGVAYVAPSGAHLVINPDARITVAAAPRLHFFRPSADWLFESGASSFQDRQIAIVLSGRMDDGAAKLRAVRRVGGTVFVQDPATCRYPEMPSAAIATGHVDAVLSIAQMPAAIARVFSRRDSLADSVRWEYPFGKARLPA
jgi:two-component system chemotaxis response regulator CheB